MGTKISALPQDTAPTLTDYLATLDIETGNNKKVLLSDLANLFRNTGEIVPYAGRSVPSSAWLFCDGSAVNRTTYANLFAILCASVGTFTVTIATPAVVTLSGHGLQTGDQVYLTTTGALPTGLTANTLYYAVRIDANTFNLATSRANAYAGTKIATSGTQSGTHTLRDCPFGLGDGSTTFNVPDARGRTLAGNDSMNGTVASRLTLARSQGVYGNKGSTGGAESHTLITAELASHTHLENFSSGANNGVTGIPQSAGQSSVPGINSAYTTASAGSDTAHNNVQPTILTNYIIKT